MQATFCPSLLHAQWIWKWLYYEKDSLVVHFNFASCRVTKLLKVFCMRIFFLFILIRWTMSRILFLYLLVQFCVILLHVVSLQKEILCIQNYEYQSFITLLSRHERTTFCGFFYWNKQVALVKLVAFALFFSSNCDSKEKSSLFKIQAGREGQGTGSLSTTVASNSMCQRQELRSDGKQGHAPLQSNQASMKGMESLSDTVWSDSLQST